MIDTPRTCPHCSEPVEAGHSFCGSCGNDLPEPDCSICGKPRQWNGPYEMPHWCGTPPAAIDTSAPLSLLGENPQVYGSMGAYYREPDEPIDRSKYPTLLSDPRVKQREAPGTPIDRLASVGPWFDIAHKQPPNSEPVAVRGLPEELNDKPHFWRNWNSQRGWNDLCPWPEWAFAVDELSPHYRPPREPQAPASPVIEHTPKYPMHRDCPDPAKCPCECDMCMGGPIYDIAAAQQSVVEAAKAWRASINQDEWPTLLAKTMLAVDALSEAENTK